MSQAKFLIDLIFLSLTFSFLANANFVCLDFISNLLVDTMALESTGNVTDFENSGFYEMVSRSIKLMMTNDLK